FALYLIAWAVAPRAPITARLIFALVFEVTWEILENSPLVIEHYRRQALAQGYAGDSVVNSIADSAAMTAGFLLARLLPFPVTATLALTMELSVGYAIRDNLT